MTGMRGKRGSQHELFGSCQANFLGFSWPLIHDTSDFFDDVLGAPTAEPVKPVRFKNSGDTRVWIAVIEVQDV